MTVRTWFGRAPPVRGLVRCSPIIFGKQNLKALTLSLGSEISCASCRHTIYTPLPELVMEVQPPWDTLPRLAMGDSYATRARLWSDGFRSTSAQNRHVSRVPTQLWSSEDITKVAGNVRRMLR